MNNEREKVLDYIGIGVLSLFFIAGFLIGLIF